MKRVTGVILIGRCEMLDVPLGLYHSVGHAAHAAERITRAFISRKACVVYGICPDDVGNVVGIGTVMVTHDTPGVFEPLQMWEDRRPLK